MKKWVALLGGAMFCVLVFSMYMVVDQLGKTPNYNEAFAVQVNDKIKVPIENLEHDINVLEGNLRMSGKVIGRLRDSVNRIQGGSPLNKSEVNDIPELLNNKEKTKTYKLPELQEHDYRTTKKVDQAAIAKPTSDDGCVFSRVKSWKSTDVKMLDAMDAIPFDNPDGGAWKQGWDVTYDDSSFSEKPLQVFVVPHSHNDPGWIKTLDQYYRDQTRHILDNVVDALAADSRRRFIWAEISYFSMWWNDADSTRKANVLKQLKSGQLEIVTGGWVMNDEANPHFYAMLDQMIEGHQWIAANLGEDIKPVSGWAIDPFGHTSTMPYLLKRMGFTSMLIQRVHYQVKKYLAKRRDLEFMWRQTWDHGSTTDIYCHMMPFYSYDVPHTCGPDPKICCQFDFRRLPGGGISCPWRVPPVEISDFNIDSRARTLVDQYKKKASLYKTNVVLIPLGDDFRYEKTFETHAQFTNYQKLFDYINSHSELKTEAKFGTLSDYFNAVYSRTGTEAGHKPSETITLSGDFFTYSDRDDHYWSGYYTSRPFYKNLDRVMESHHRGAEILFYLAQSHAKRGGSAGFPGDSLYKLLSKARRNMGLFQHHDAITGTAKDFVVVDYGTRLHESLKHTQEVMSDSAKFLLQRNKADAPVLEPGEERLNQDSMPQKKLIIVSSTPRSVVFYNPLSKPRTEVVSVYVSGPLVTVTDSEGKIVPSQANPVFESGNRFSSSKFELLFVAHTSSLGLSVYHIQESSTDSDSHMTAQVTAYTNEQGSQKPNDKFTFNTKKRGSETITMQNEDIMAEFDSNNGLIKSMTDKADNSRININIGFITYGTKSYGDRSGAYLFLPDGPAQPHFIGDDITVYTSIGKLMQEVRVQLRNVEHIVRLYAVDGPQGKSLDIKNVVDIRNMGNKEFLMRITTDIENQNREFYTDLNGLTVQKRRTLDKLPTQANFYPMPAMTFLQDRRTRLTVLSAQPNGVASLQKGSLEIVLDRRLNQDDNRGLGQGVLDNKPTPADFKILLETFKNTKESTKREPLAYPSLLSHRLSDELLRPQFTFIAKAETTNAQLMPSFAGLMSPLPCDVSLLMLRTIQDISADSRPSDEALMILHRRGYDCTLVNKCLKNTSGGKVLLDNLFKDLSLSKLNSVSLTMLHEHEQKDPATPIDIEPMELYSFKVKLS